MYLIFLLLYFVSLLRAMTSDDRIQSSNWCELDGGFTTITDDQGYRHGAYISLTSDGSVWVRVGRDYLTFDWSLVNQRRIRVQTAVMDDEMLNMLKFLSYSSYCVLTDLELTFNLESGWNPSYLTVFDPKTKDTSIVSVKNIRDCRTNTTMELSADKQGIRCDGWGELTACGLRNMPESGQASPTWFLKYVNFDLYGPDHWYCSGKESNNFYSFVGSYYFAYMKLASCDVPKDSRSIGNDVRLRRHKDALSDVIIIPDPSQTVLSDDCVIQAWQIYAQVVSVQHSVYLQVWRPIAAAAEENVFALVGQTFIQPTELRFHERALAAEDFLRTAKGDVLGIYFPQFNPVGWSPVPCGSSRQRHVYVRSPGGDVTVGRTFTFTTVAKATDSCRAYSIQALFANRTNSKMIDSWVCPSSDSSAGSLIRSNRAELKTSGGSQDKHPVDGIKRFSPQLPKTVFVSPQDQGVHSKRDRHSPGGVVAPLRLMMMVLCGLLLTMVLIGFLSYYNALRT